MTRIKARNGRRIALLSTLAIAFGLGLFLYRQKADQARRVAVLEEQGAKVMDWKTTAPVTWIRNLLRLPTDQATLPHAPFAYPESVSFPATPVNGNAAADALKGLSSVKSVFIFAEEPVVPDELLAALSRLPKLRMLDLTMANISRDGWKHIGALTNLRELYLSENALSDDDFQAFATLVQMEKLSLIGTKITSRSVPILARFRHLKELDLSETAITAQDGEQLKTALPNTLMRVGGSAEVVNAPH